MIALRGVSKTVPSGSGTLTILHPLDLVVPARQVMAITGPSGSGKSTLLGLIAGLDSPSTGQIAIDGTDITSLDEDALARLRGRRIGFVFQFFHLLPSLTALENVLIPMEIAGVSGARARAASLLEEVGLSERSHHYPSQLSGGEQQRVAIARALANDPPLLLADEPTGNLDSGTGRHVIDLLLAINRSRGTTLVLVTHDPELAAVADVAIALRDGHVVSRTEKRERSNPPGSVIQVTGRRRKADDVRGGSRTAPTLTGTRWTSSSEWRRASCGRPGAGCCSSSSAWRSASPRSSRCVRSSRASAAVSSARRARRLRQTSS